MSDLPKYVELSLFCDRCDAQLTVSANTREEALAKLHAEIVAQGWHMGDTATLIRARDLCGACNVSARSR